MNLGLNPKLIEQGRAVANNWLMNIPNDEKAEETIKAVKLLIKLTKGPGFGVRIRGRHSDRKGLFQKIGRHHSLSSNANDFRVDELKYCEYFALYLREYDPYNRKRK